MRHVELDEGLDRTYRLELVLLTEELDLDVDTLLGADVEMSWSREDDERRIHGIVRRVADLGTFSDRLHIRAEVEPAFSLLDLTRRSRIFQAKSVPQIVQEVVGEPLQRLGRKVEISKLTAAHDERDYCVQFRETDLGFIQRILAEDGISYAFEHDEGAETLVLVDDSTSLPSVGVDLLSEDESSEVRIVPVHTGTGDHADVEVIERFERLRATQTSDTEIAAWDWKTGQPARFVTTVAREESEGWAHGERYEHGERRLVEDANGDGPHVDPTAWLARHARQRVDVGARQMSGAGNVMAFSSGHAFELTGHPHVVHDGEYLLTRVVHRADCPEVDPHASTLLAGPNYANHFECISRSLPWRPSVPAKPRMHGHHTATVVGPEGDEIHTDEHGRIRVWMHWDREGAALGPDASCWLRVAQPWAGPGWGSMFIPRVGMEVLVSFIDGDPDRPICIGTLYNGANRPPYTLPDEKTKSTIKSSSSPGGDGFNELTFEDAAGREEVFLHAQRNLREVVGSAHSITVGATQSESVGTDQTIHVGADRRVTVDGNEVVTIGGVSEDPSFSGHKMQVTGHHVVDASKSASLTAPESITLTCKDTKIVLTPEQIRLEAGGGSALVLDVAALLSSAKLAKLELDGAGNLRAASSAPATMTLDTAVTLVSNVSSKLTLDDKATLVASGEAAKLTLDANAEMVGEVVTCRARAATLEMDTDAALTANTTTLHGAAGRIEAGPTGASMTGASVTTQAMGTASMSGKLVKLN